MTDEFSDDDKQRCPLDKKRRCLSPGPQRDGLCCEQLANYPLSFSVRYRNPGHWDVYAGCGRQFRIRGEPGKVMVSDERRHEGPQPRDWLYFKTVSAALIYCAEELMIRG